MVLGYEKPLYLLAFDHRGSFERDLFNASHPISHQVRAGIVDAKEVIYEGFEEAIRRGAPREAADVLVDEQFGASVARRARKGGYVLAMPVEKSGQAEFDFEYGEEFGRHIKEFDPAFAKVLVLHNPEGDRELNRRQIERLARLGTWLRDHARRFLFELLVPATPVQLHRPGGNQGRYDCDIRPDLVVETIGAMQEGGVEPDIWKIEGLDSREDCTKVVAQARTGGRHGVSCIVLGRGADAARVLEWLRIAAGVPGFEGFAVGRTLWEDPLKDFIAGTTDRHQAVLTIADRYLETVDGFATARSIRSGPNRSPYEPKEEPW